MCSTQGGGKRHRDWWKRQGARALRLLAAVGPFVPLLVIFAEKVM